MRGKEFFVDHDHAPDNDPSCRHAKQNIVDFLSWLRL
jgi:hypothetical protein